MKLTCAQLDLHSQRRIAYAGCLGRRTLAYRGIPGTHRTLETLSSASATGLGGWLILARQKASPHI
eukprot:3115994-Prymnesium_polylepis.2